MQHPELGVCLSPRFEAHQAVAAPRHGEFPLKLHNLFASTCICNRNFKFSHIPRIDEGVRHLKNIHVQC